MTVGDALAAVTLVAAMAAAAAVARSSLWRLSMDSCLGCGDRSRRSHRRDERHRRERVHHGHGVVSGTEYIQIMSASTTPGPASAIAHGAFTGAGEALLGDAKLGRMVFPAGTIVLSHEAGHSTSQFNPSTCLAIISCSRTRKVSML